MGRTTSWIRSIATCSSIANFRMSAFPYPDLELTFSETVHRLSFELGALSVDDIQVTLLSAGAVVDTTTFASIGWNQLYFYGLENEAGFDEVWIHVTQDPVRRTGYFSFDNLQFESFEPAVQTPDSFTRIGMMSSSGSVLSSSNPVHELTALLVDHADGSLVMDAAVIDRPMAGVFFSSAAGDPEVDVTAAVLGGGSDRFVPTIDGAWRLDLLSETMFEPGFYRVTMLSPNDLDYTIDSTCDVQISRIAPEEPEVHEEPGDDECELKSKKDKKDKKDKEFKKRKRHKKHMKNKWSKK